MSALANGSGDAILLTDDRPAGWLRLILSGYLRLLGLGFIALSLLYWSLLLGAVDPSLAFEAVPTVRQTHLVGMATLAPVAAVGLWSTLSWGRVVWLLTVGVELVFALWFGVVFPWTQMLLLGHGGSIAIWLILQAFANRSDKKA